MDKKIVGANAGKVWHALNEADGISIPELARKVNLSVAVSYTHLTLPTT